MLGLGLWLAWLAIKFMSRLGLPGLLHGSIGFVSGFSSRNTFGCMAWILVFAHIMSLNLILINIFCNRPIWSNMSVSVVKALRSTCLAFGVGPHFYCHTLQNRLFNWIWINELIRIANRSIVQGPWTQKNYLNIGRVTHATSRLVVVCEEEPIPILEGPELIPDHLAKSGSEDAAREWRLRKASRIQVNLVRIGVCLKNICIHRLD